MTRLIKASKSQKPTRDSILGGGSTSGSSLSIPKPEVQVGQKLSVAQAELQACEAHLAAKEQELNAFRTHTIRVGLQARCGAMVECGWRWGEMGKEGMRALETLDASAVNGHGTSSLPLTCSKLWLSLGCIGVSLRLLIRLRIFLVHIYCILTNTTLQAALRCTHTSINPSRPLNMPRLTSLP